MLQFLFLPRNLFADSVVKILIDVSNYLLYIIFSKLLHCITSKLVGRSKVLLVANVF